MCFLDILLAVRVHCNPLVVSSVGILRIDVFITAMYS